MTTHVRVRRAASTASHDEKETLAVDIIIPLHAARVTTPLFRKSRAQLIINVGGRCYICQRTAKEAGPLEAHHFPIERCMAEMIDWSEGSLMQRDYPDFDWASFDPADPYKFVDDMTVNGLLLCKDHHTHGDSGIHTLPHPLWIAQRYGQEGYQFSPSEVIHHDAT